MKLLSVLSRPNVDLKGMQTALPHLREMLQTCDEETIQLAEVNIKYEGYIQREKDMAEKMNRLEAVRLRDDIDYSQFASLSTEAKEKLTRMRPQTIGQASRISGVSPSDVSVLLIHLGR